MNTLTKNRILQKGDEYLTNSGDWKKVPDCDIGMLIQFTQYTEVRRPSEQPFTAKQCKPTAQERRLDGLPYGAPNAPQPKEPISAGGRSPASTIVETPSPAPEPLRKATARTEHVEKQDHTGARDLPTVISAKAHKKPERSNPPEPPPPNEFTQIKFEKNGSTPIWRGRNGTFNGLGVTLHNDDQVISLNPVGVRGRSDNCLIQIPKSAIPQVIDWLREQSGYLPHILPEE